MISKIKRRTLPPKRIPHVLGFAIIIFVAAKWLDVPAIIWMPIWFGFFWMICEPEDD